MTEVAEKSLENPNLIKGVLIVGGLAVVGVVAYMGLTGGTFGDLVSNGVSGAIEGVVGGIKGAWNELDPKNKTGQFFTDVGNASYWRGAGTVPNISRGCPQGWDKDAGLCYVKCAKNYHGVGPACWKNQFHSGISSTNPKKDPIKAVNRRLA